jgi:Carboxypeptidase regulatory-like domain
MTRLGLRGLFLSRSFLATLTLMAAILLCVSAIPAWPQVASSGTVTGTVSDKTGAVVPSATVTMTDAATQEKRTATTNSAGLYTFVNVPSGTYDITVTKQGFKNFRIGAQQVKVGLPITVNATLEVGAATQTIEVAATGVELQTTNATIGNTVTGIALQSLPTLGRDVSTFVTLQPGISPDGGVAGTAVDQSTFMLDGGNNTNDMDGSMSVYTVSFAGDPTGGVSGQGGNANLAPGPTGVMPTPADSVEEFKVSAALQGSDFSNSSGAQVQVVTKRGTNVWHGTVYEYYLDNNWNANTWDNNFTGTPLPSYHYNRFGAAAGGPILPDMLGGKWYFFANYQGFRWPNSATIERAVPS